MPHAKTAAEQHHRAAEHHDKAAQHHRHAAEHHKAGDHEDAGHQAHLAHAHQAHAEHHGLEAAKAHAELLRSSRPPSRLPPSLTNRA